jgi:hypothetical protein
MSRTVLLALRDLFAIVAVLVVGLAVLAMCAVGLFVLCLHVLARMMW